MQTAEVTRAEEQASENSAALHSTGLTDPAAAQERRMRTADGDSWAQSGSERRGDGRLG